MRKSKTVFYSYAHPKRMDSNSVAKQIFDVFDQKPKLSFKNL